ncbi:MAG: hypothetical protein ABI324_24970 [Ktedonobacteraceae bacterium]
MGYYTEFTGTFKFEKPLAGRHLAYLQGFNETNHYHWNPELLQNELDPFREAVGLPLGEHGCYFTGNHTTRGHDDQAWRYWKDHPAKLGEQCPGKPYFRCGWRPGDDGTELLADLDKFYDYVEWLQYLLDHFIVPWDYVLCGIVTWKGQDEEDIGTIIVSYNVLVELKGYALDQRIL